MTGRPSTTQHASTSALQDDEGPLRSRSGSGPNRPRQRDQRPRWYTVAFELENKGSVARDHLAAERTYLAYLRTSLALASIGIGELRAVFRGKKVPLTASALFSHSYHAAFSSSFQHDSFPLEQLDCPCGLGLPRGSDVLRSARFGLGAGAGSHQDGLAGAGTTTKSAHRASERSSEVPAPRETSCELTSAFCIASPKLIPARRLGRHIHRAGVAISCAGNRALLHVSIRPHARTFDVPAGKKERRLLHLLRRWVKFFQSETSLLSPCLIVAHQAEC